MTNPVIPQEDLERKAAPMFRGLLGYFPGALFQVAAHSMRSDRKHNGHLPEEGAPRWNRGKSSDHDDCIIRHTAEQHTDPLYHKTARAWRALADLQEYLEREHGYAHGAHSYTEPSIADFDLESTIVDIPRNEIPPPALSKWEALGNRLWTWPEDGSL